MRTLKEDFFDNIGIGEKSQIEQWLRNNKINNFKINDDLTIDVNGYVDLKNYTENQLPDYIQFGNIKGSFYINISNIISLQGCPKEVGGCFSCRECSKLESLEGAPEKVGRDFYCYNCPKLESLNGAPKFVGRDFNCNMCKKLKSIQGSPRIINGNFTCGECSKLESLNGAPEFVGGDFNCKKCASKFIKDDVKKVSKVKGKIYT